MRIALDATYSVGADLSGVGLYCRQILRGLAGAHPREEFLWCYRPHRLLRSFGDPMPANCRRRLLLERRVAGDPDVFHGLNQRTPSARSRRLVTTFHDLFVLTAEYSAPEFRRRFARQARQAAERSDLIIAVSRFTASQVEGLLGVEPARLRVIHHGVQAPAAVPPPVSGRQRLILHVGAVQQRKNIVRLVEAFERQPAGWRLALAGSHGYGADGILRRIAASPRRADIDVLGYVPVRRLEELYERASVLAFPSLDEGFGLPVLEAMARGIPVVASDRSALPEISGDAAMLVNPDSADEIAAAITNLIENEDLRADLAVRGLARAAAFRWEEAVEKTWGVYRELS